MFNNYLFYRCYPDRGMASEGDPGLLAAKEVVRAVCDAGFQRNGTSMKNLPSSPHCYYQFVKPPLDGMFMLWAVKKTDKTTLNILVDTRLHPSFVMIENNPEWKEETKEVVDTLERMINNGAAPYNWHVKLRKYQAEYTQHLDLFVSALAYLGELEYMTAKHNGYNLTGLIAKTDCQPINQETVEELKPLFYNNEPNVRRFLREIIGMSPNNITDLVNLWVKKEQISNFGTSRKGTLWKILHKAGLYSRTRQNWCRRVF